MVKNDVPVNITATHSYSNNGSSGYNYLYVNTGDYSIIDINFTVPDESILVSAYISNSSVLKYVKNSYYNTNAYQFAKDYSVSKISGDFDIYVSGNGNFALDINIATPIGPGYHSGQFKATVTSTQTSSSKNAILAYSGSNSTTISGTRHSLQE